MCHVTRNLKAMRRQLVFFALAPRGVARLLVQEGHGGCILFQIGESLLKNWLIRVSSQMAESPSDVSARPGVANDDPVLTASDKPETEQMARESDHIDDALFGDPSDLAPGRDPDGGDQQIRCWVVSNGRAGTQNQALGLAEALARRLPMKIAVKQIKLRAPWPSLPRFLWRDPFALLSAEKNLLRPPFPDLWIAAGADTVPFTIEVKKQAPRTFTIQTQHPRVGLDRFDLVVPPTHDKLEGDNVIATLGAPCRINSETIATALETTDDWFDGLTPPMAAIMIGGDSRTLTLDGHVMSRIARLIRTLRKKGFSVIVSRSRRTHAGLWQGLRSRFADDQVRFYDGAEGGSVFNPYPALLGMVKLVFVTEDSVNMVSEAAGAGVPVYTISLPGKLGKFRTLYQALARRGIVRRFRGEICSWQCEPLDEANRIAPQIVERFKAFRRGRDVS